MTTTAPTALQRTPDGAAELRVPDSTDGAVPPPIKAWRLRAGPREQAAPGIEPGTTWQSLRGELPAAIQHNGLLHARPAFRSPSSLPPGMRATPVMSCAPTRLRGHRLGVPSPCPPNTDARAHPGYRLRKSRGQARCARSHRVGPRPPTIRPPRGLPGSLHCPAQRSAVLAASRPSPAGARVRAALTRLRLGAPWARPVAFAECRAPHSQGERHATQEEPHHAHAAA